MNLKLAYFSIDHSNSTSEPPPRELLKFCYWCLRGSHIAIGLAAVASILSGIAETLTAALMGFILDLIIKAEPTTLLSENFFILGFVFVFLLGVRPFFFAFSAYLQSVVLGPGLRTLVASRLHRWTLGHSKTFFENDFAGRIAQKEVQASGALTDVVIESIHTVLFALTSVLAAVAIISLIDWRIGIIVVVWFCGFILVMRFFMPRIKVKAASSANAQANATGQIVDTLSNIDIVKLFANSSHEDKAALRAFKTLRNKLIVYGGELVWFRTFMMVYASFVFVAVLACSIALWVQGLASTGEAVAAGSVSMRLTMMAGWVGFSLMTIYTKLGEVEDAMKTLTVPQTMNDKIDAGNLLIPNGKIEFKNISFSYGSKVSGLNQISLTVQPGEKLGLVGASGAGKSTLISLLLRLHDPEVGSVIIDGQDISNVKQDSLRRQISMVSQETSMFNRSAKENILYGKPCASAQDVISAAIKAGAHEFIKDLIDSNGRKGYDAFLGERGVKLSGGQRQRIALARAILKNAPILILDEATSALDSEVEATIQKALEQVMQGKTVLAVAHRLSTISNMDRIIVLESGKIVEQGSHSELQIQNGVYSNFWKRQSGGFIEFKNAAE
jgi:ATP-binding cassette subfamily B protein